MQESPPSSKEKYSQKFFTNTDNNVKEFLKDDVFKYVEEFLLSEHPARKGDVCPFMREALKRNLIYYTPVINFPEISKTFSEAIDFYVKSGTKKGAIVIQLGQDVLSNLNKKLYEDFLYASFKNSLIFSVFDDNNYASSLHDRNFRPFRSPEPILVIREIISSDLDNLKLSSLSIINRVLFLETYIKLFSEYKNEKRNKKAKRLLVLEKFKRALKFNLKK